MKDHTCLLLVFLGLPACVLVIFKILFYWIQVFLRPCPCLCSSTWVILPMHFRLFESDSPTVTLQFSFLKESNPRVLFSHFFCCLLFGSFCSSICFALLWGSGLKLTKFRFAVSENWKGICRKVLLWKHSHFAWISQRNICLNKQYSSPAMSLFLILILNGLPHWISVFHVTVSWHVLSHLPKGQFS